MITKGSIKIGKHSDFLIKNHLKQGSRLFRRSRFVRIASQMQNNESYLFMVRAETVKKKTSPFWKLLIQSLNSA